MPSIITLTMNPALDTSMTIDQVRPEIKLRCSRPKRDPGGGGLNVARAAKELGGEATAIHTAGGHTGRELSDLLEEEGLAHQSVEIEDATRENVTVIEDEGGRQFRFNAPGARLSEDEVDRCADAVEKRLASGDLLVLSGSLPPGADSTFYARIARIAKERSARVVGDTSGDALRALADEGATMLKPNVRELNSLAGRELSDPGEFADAAAELVREGAAETVIVSMGKQGALLVRDGARRFAAAPDVEIESRIGAGDSMVAACALAMLRDMDDDDVLAHGVAAGAAAVMTPGTCLLRRSDFEDLAGQVDVGSRKAALQDT